MATIRLIAFDTFGTVFDMAGVPRAELRAYGEHIRRPDWSPLVLPESWDSLPAHPDAAEGIARLRKQFTVVTCSNGPLRTLARASKHNGISWDAIVPLELFRVFKPNPTAYQSVCRSLGFEPAEMMMVTANETFGDLEAAASLGMTPVLIRGKSGVPTVTDLAARLTTDGPAGVG